VTRAPGTPGRPDRRGLADRLAAADRSAAGGWWSKTMEKNVFSKNELNSVIYKETDRKIRF
jgi:hypothetical protein